MSSTETSNPTPGHVPVLLRQVVEMLDPRPGMVMVDCTVGRGGHAAVIAPMLGPGGRYIALDADAMNLAFASERLRGVGCRVDAMHANFADLPGVLASLSVRKTDLILADLGFASNQMDDPERGFSFSRDGPLDMRLDASLPTTAADLVNTMDERELADVIYQFGEDRLSRKIARFIVEHRRQNPILTTCGLAEVVRRAYGYRARSERIDPATRTFMALRIAVNGELESLDRLLASLWGVLAPAGRAGVISFHSLEDRRVKRAFQALAKDAGGRC